MAERIIADTQDWMNSPYGSFDESWEEWDDEGWHDWRLYLDDNSQSHPLGFDCVGTNAHNASGTQCYVGAQQNPRIQDRVEPTTRLDGNKQQPADAGSDLFSPLLLPRTKPTDSMSDQRLQGQHPRFDGDLYTAEWIRGEGSDRAGWCGFCSSWHRMKDSAFWYHMHYSHGISYTTGKFSGIQTLLGTHHVHMNELHC